MSGEATSAAANASADQASEPALDAAQEAALLRQLHATCRHLNQLYFRGALKPVQLALSDARGFLGRYLHELRTIELARAFVLRESWGSLVEVLKHELAHQFVLEVLREHESPHGPAFRGVCERLGIDARSSGVPQASAASPESERVLERVHKLLALAQSDNRHEAEAAAAAAQRLMLRHNIEGLGPRATRTYTFRHLGRVTGRVSEWERRLGNILSEHFFVEIIWVPAYRAREQKSGSVMEAIGSPENLELAAYVYEFLVGSGEQLWRAHKQASGVRHQRDRMTYLAGVMSGFAQKLEGQARAHKADGLVWVPEAQLREYTRKRHPSLRTVSHAGHRRREAFEQGQAAGRSVHLHRGISHGQGGAPKLLKG